MSEGERIQRGGYDEGRTRGSRPNERTALIVLCHDARSVARSESDGHFALRTFATGKIL